MDDANEKAVIPPEVEAQVPPPHEPVVPEPEVTPDPEKERDVRAVPVAHGVLEDLAGLNSVSDVQDRSEFTNVIVKILKRSLEADLNVALDNPYVFQLALGAFGAFNQFIQSCKMAESENKRYSTIAHEMMVLFADAKVPMGMQVKTEEQVAALESIRPQIEEIFAREMLTKLEVSYILEGLMNALKITHQVFSDNVKQAVDRMEAKILQVEFVSDLTMKQLDATLQTSIEEILAKTS